MVIVPLIVIILVAKKTAAQGSNPADSLRELIKSIEHNSTPDFNDDTTRISAFLKWSDLVVDEDPDSSIALDSMALEIVNSLMNTRKYNTDEQKTMIHYKYLCYHNMGYANGLLGDTSTAMKYFNKGIETGYSIDDSANVMFTLEIIAQMYGDLGYYEASYKYFEKGLHLSEQMKDYKQISFFSNQMASIHSMWGNISKALSYYDKCLEVNGRINDKEGMGRALNNMAAIYMDQGDVEKALDYYTQCLKLFEEIDFKMGVAYTLNNIGFIYGDMGDYEKDLEYRLKCLEILKEVGDPDALSMVLNNIGHAYVQLKDTTNALAYYYKCIEEGERSGSKRTIAYVYNNIGALYRDNNKYEEALTYYNKSVALYEEIQDKAGIVFSFLNLGRAHHDLGNEKSALKYAEKAYIMSKDLGYTERIENAASLMKDIMYRKGDYKKALDYFVEEIRMHDSVQNESNYRITQKQQARYEFEKQAAVDSTAHANEMAIATLELQNSEKEREKQLYLIWTFVFGFIVILVFAIIIYRMFVQKKRANVILHEQKQKIEIQNSQLFQAKEEITAQRDEIAAQRDEIAAQRDMVIVQKEFIEHQKEEIDDSIRYAKRIQQAVLPDLNLSTEVMGEHFIVFRPKDVVSGDFYWAIQSGEWSIITVADCTGHGVPGAFMSMLGISFLNEIVRKSEFKGCAFILNGLRKLIIDALKQTGEEGTQKDGMDMSIAAINRVQKKALWAGANNPLWIFRKEKTKEHIEDSYYLIEDIKPDKMPVAVHEIMKDFSDHELKLSSGDRLFLFSDGFPDQFGGEKGKKFLYKRFRRLLAETSSKLISEQGIALEAELNRWMHQPDMEYEQIDDITVVGLEY